MVVVEMGYLFYASVSGIYTSLGLQELQTQNWEDQHQGRINTQQAGGLCKTSTSATAKNPVRANLGTDQRARVFQGHVQPFNCLRAIDLGLGVEFYSIRKWIKYITSFQA